MAQLGTKTTGVAVTALQDHLGVLPAPSGSSARTALTPVPFAPWCSFSVWLIAFMCGHSLVLPDLSLQPLLKLCRHHLSQALCPLSFSPRYIQILPPFFSWTDLALSIWPRHSVLLKSVPSIPIPRLLSLVHKDPRERLPSAVQVCRKSARGCTQAGGSVGFWSHKHLGALEQALVQGDRRATSLRESS